MKIKKISKQIKKVQKWWKKTRKQFYKAICSLIATLLCIACGTTKAVVSNPENGTYTTITITTNNPITTNMQPNTDAHIKVK